ncbi:DUF6265 family protein [Sphingopyxis sp.]|uniref:DUF6265 family protein n=1 Tax=Sphingopyxis sp. TaxID=1908224 RepID=UPI003D6C849E
MKAIFLSVAAALLVAASPATTVDDLAWLAGQWSREEGERWTEESWTSPRGGVMLGHSRSGRGDALREFEFLRIVAGEDGTPTYIAQPGGGAAVAFRLVQRDAASATFENAAHDYPQRIHYIRDGETMTATISMVDGSKPMRWTFRRR